MKVFRVGTGSLPALIDLDEKEELVIGDPPRRKWHEQTKVPIVGEGPEIRAKKPKTGLCSSAVIGLRNPGAWR